MKEAIIDSILFTLTEEHLIKKLKPTLDEAQQKCVKNFLIWVNNQANTFLMYDKLNRAINTYWQ